MKQKLRYYFFDPNPVHLFLYFVRALFQRKYNIHFPVYSSEFVQITGQEASDLIKIKLTLPEPLMISRIGSTELWCLNICRAIHMEKPFMEKAKQLIHGDNIPFWWDSRVFEVIQTHAGFFPAKKNMIERFCELLLKDIKNIDILGSWLAGEIYFKDELSHCKKIHIHDLEPFFTRDPWTTSLQGKTILVIHPFTESIIHQYNRRELLFSDNRILPEFEIKTIKAVQSLGGANTRYKNWFDALDFMSGQIASEKFDIAIIGCGAYGLPLAAFVKRLGKKAIHLGGVTQILFGIKGFRWEVKNHYTNLFNEYWIHPLPQEHPVDYKKVESGCYW